MADETTPLHGPRRRLAGRYLLQGVLGEGGMAEVQLAHDERLGRQVAVKILHGRFAHDPSFVARFRREAQAAASLNHPNVVAVYDTGEDDGRPFIVMEYVSGRTLRDVLRTQGVLPHRAAEIAAQAAAALHYAHERGLVHRDVKPANIMISDEGQVKVADFGIARAVDAENVTQTAAVFGTAAYVAPEQARGADVDRRTDVYALGCVLYEMLTGQQPFSGDSAVAVAYKHLSDDPVPPRRINSNIAASLEAVTLRAMAKRPEERYQSARALQHDLERALEGRAVASPPPAATQALPRERTVPVPPPAPAYEQTRAYADEPPPPTRRGGGGWLVALAVLLLLGIAGYLLFAQFDEPDVVETPVPNVVNQPLSQAQQILLNEGFRTIVADPVNDPAVPEGNVVATDPPPDTLLAQGSIVTLVPSAGPQPALVPPVAGLPEAQAREQLQEAGLVVGERREQPSDTVEAGAVISTVPPPGTEVPAGAEVALIVSTGPQSVEVPEVEGRSEAAAIRILATACEPQPCLRGEVVERRFDDEVPAGVVLAQSPEAGQRVEIGSLVQLVVSRGPRPEPTPSPTQVQPTPTQQRSPTQEPSPSPFPAETPST